MGLKRLVLASRRPARPWTQSVTSSLLATRRAAIRICATSCIVSMLEALSPTWRRCPPPGRSCLPCLPCLPRGKPDQLCDAAHRRIVTCNLTLVQPQECPPGRSSGRCRGPHSVSRAASSSPQLVAPAGVPHTRALTTAPASTTARGRVSSSCSSNTTLSAGPQSSSCLSTSPSTAVPLPPATSAGCSWDNPACTRLLDSLWLRCGGLLHMQSPNSSRR
jgi:hypothetical protein